MRKHTEIEKAWARVGREEAGHGKYWARELARLELRYLGVKVKCKLPTAR